LRLKGSEGDAQAACKLEGRDKSDPGLSLPAFFSAFLQACRTSHIPVRASSQQAARQLIQRHPMLTLSLEKEFASRQDPAWQSGIRNGLP
jgi:hypothetical protein